METKLSELEARLTSENRRIVNKYIHNCIKGLYATMLLGAFDDYKGFPISNAFYLNKLTELEEFRKEGHEFVDVEATIGFRKMREKVYDSNRNPHLTAAELHCEYFRLKGKELGYDLSIGTIVEYDPLTSREDKNDIFSRDPSRMVVESERYRAEKFFVSLARAEKKLFDQAFTIANFDRYKDKIF